MHNPTIPPLPDTWTAQLEDQLREFLDPMELADARVLRAIEEEKDDA